MILDPEEDKALQLTFLLLTIVANVFCWWRWWNLFNVDRADLAKGFPLKQGLKRLIFPGILFCLLLFQISILLYESRSLLTVGLFSFAPMSLLGVQTIRAYRNYRKRIAGKPLPKDQNDLVTLDLWK